MTLFEVREGDVIHACGKFVRVCEILTQDFVPADKYRPEAYLDLEFLDQKGDYRHYKSIFDGGILYREKDFVSSYDEEVSETVKRHVDAYFASHLSKYEMQEVWHKSNHPEEADLYMVVGKKDDGSYTLWTSWNESTKSLNWGHYGLSLEKCREVAKEQFSNVFDK